MKNNSITALLLLALIPNLAFAGSSNEALLKKIKKNTFLIKTLMDCPSLSSARFIDNGDGTICDHQTGLMWEMKNASDGTQDFTNPRDVDNSYTWSTSADFPPPNGTAFTDFLARLNGTIASSALSEQLGGYRDWRLPTSAELQTILDCSFGSPCIDPVFGPTSTRGYWSSTISTNVGNVYTVSFGGSEFPVDDEAAFDFYRVRAVRGGR